MVLLLRTLDGPVVDGSESDQAQSLVIDPSPVDHLNTRNAA